jgi:YHS domain-containing protein
MKLLKNVVAASLIVCALAAPVAAIAADQKAGKKAKPYVLKTCIVSGEKLGEMGDPVAYVHEGREIKFCCKDCVKTFKKDPAKYVKKIEAAEAKQGKKG